MDRRYRLCDLCLLACFLAACGGGDGSDPPVVIPPEATAAEATVKDQMQVFVPHLAGVQAALTFVLNPGAGLTPGMALAPDPQPGAPPNGYVFNGILDDDGDSISETTLSGKAAFAGDPYSLDWSPMTGEATVGVQVPVVGRVYQATVAFRMTDGEVRISGSGTFTDPLGGSTTTIDVPAASPVIVKPAPGAGGLVANACGYNVDGSLPVKLTQSTGTYDATMLFSPNSGSVAVQRVSFRDSAGQTTAMPDSTVTLTCRSGGTADDWVGVYDQNWACLPIEHGQAQLTLTASDAKTLSVADEDPPGSGDVNTFTATLLAASPHAAEGYFDGGPVGYRYREHFTWALSKDHEFSQWSRYQYMEGPNQGTGGLCAARAKRRP